jgi:hypothetical protein
MIASGMTDDPSLPATNRTAILVAAFDSQLKWAETIRRAMESRGFACQLIVPSDSRHAVSDRQMEDYCQSGLTYMTWTELMTASLNAEVVVLAIQGPQVQRFCPQHSDPCTRMNPNDDIAIPRQTIVPRCRALAETIKKALSGCRLKREVNQEQMTAV